MRTTVPTYPQYTDIILQPRLMQWVIYELPIILLTLTTFVLSGMESAILPMVLRTLAVLLSLKLIYSLIYMRGIEYRITDQQILYDHGVFRRERQYIELYRVVDFAEKRNLMQLLFGLKNVSIYSTDRTMRKLDLIGIDCQIDLVSHIRERVNFNKIINGIYEITNR